MKLLGTWYPLFCGVVRWLAALNFFQRQELEQTCASQAVTKQSQRVTTKAPSRSRFEDFETDE